MNRLTYLLQAKTQYNLHSPFVFGLYNDVLIRHTSRNKLETTHLSSADSRNASIAYKLADHFGAKQLFVNGYAANNPFGKWASKVLPRLVGASIATNDNFAENKNGLVIICPICSCNAVRAVGSSFSNDTILATTGIHKDRKSEKQWEELLADRKNTLAIDLFSCGLVFFRKELSVERYVLLV